MVLHHECYSMKEANKRHSGRLIDQDQSGRIEAYAIASTCMILLLHLTSGCALSLCNNTDITLTLVI